MSMRKVKFDQWQLVGKEDLDNMQDLAEKAASWLVGALGETLVPTDLAGLSLDASILNGMVGAVLKRPDFRNETDVSYNPSNSVLTFQPGWRFLLSNPHNSDPGCIVELEDATLVGLAPFPAQPPAGAVIWVFAKCADSESDAGSLTQKVFLDPATGNETVQNAYQYRERTVQWHSFEGNALDILDGTGQLYQTMADGWSLVGSVDGSAFTPFYAFPYFTDNNNGKAVPLTSLAQVVNVIAAVMTAFFGRWHKAPYTTLEQLSSDVSQLQTDVQAKAAWAAALADFAPGDTADHIIDWLADLTVKNLSANGTTGVWLKQGYLYKVDLIAEEAAVSSGATFYLKPYLDNAPEGTAFALDSGQKNYHFSLFVEVPSGADKLLGVAYSLSDAAGSWSGAGLVRLQVTAVGKL